MDHTHSAQLLPTTGDWWLGAQYLGDELRDDDSMPRSWHGRSTPRVPPGRSRWQCRRPRPQPERLCAVPDLPAGFTDLCARAR